MRSVSEELMRTRRGFREERERESKGGRLAALSKRAGGLTEGVYSQ